MPVSITLLTIPSGSQFTSTIAADEEADKNDFAVLISLDDNGSGLTESNLSVSEGSIVAVEGSNSVWKATVRPPETAVAALTFTVAADAFSEGNTETTLDIRVSTQFPDTDAETATSLFTHSVSNERGIAVTPTRILISHESGISKFTHDGTLQSSEEISGTDLTYTNAIDVINGDILIRWRAQFGGAQRSTRRYTESAGALTEVAEYTNLLGAGITHTRLGFLTRHATTEEDLLVLPYGETDVETHESVLPSGTGVFISTAHQDDMLYFAKTTTSNFPLIGIAEITPDAEIRYRKDLNVEISFPTSVLDIFAYQNTLYLLSSSDEVVTLDIRPYRSLNKNTKTTIYPVFTTNGETIPLSQFCPDGKDFTFSVGFDKPSYLSINSNNEIAITSNAVSEATPVLAKLTGINFIDSVDFSFYLIIVPAANPTVRDVDALTMRAESSYDLFQIVSNANSITFRSGRTQPTGSSISNGVFTIGTAGGTAHFTATNANGNTHFRIDIDVLQAPDRSQFSDDFDYRIEIGGVEIPINDVLVYPSVSVSLDAIQLNAYRANEVSLTLKSDSTNDFYYNDGIADNFWSENSLNAAGFREPIKIYVDSVVGTTTYSHLLFSGTILDTAADINETRVELTCIDLSLELRNTPVEAFGTLEKWDALRQQSDEDDFAGVYVPEGSLSPIQLRSGAAWKADGTALTLRDLALPSEGAPIADTAYLTASALQVSGGFLDDNPVLKFLTQHRAEDVKFLLSQLGLNQDIYNVETDLLNATLDDPYILNRGSVPFSVEDTRITRLPVDWVHDSTNDRLLMLLSNPEAHIADVLVQYDLNADTYRVLHEFDKDISVHRIARRTSTDYYILSAEALTQDRSASALPRAIDGTGYAYDSIAEESEIKIYRYNASTDTLTEHVAADNTRPPQLGIHYWVGFENDIYIDEFEGIRPDDRGAFKFQGGNLYYRYATDSEFGVARVNTSGATSEMIDQTTLNYHNHLNFAFDVTSGGDVYLVYSVGDTDESSLVIKRRTSGGTETTRLTDTQAVDALTVLGDAGGVYLGCYEALFYNNDLYMLCPIGRVDYDEDNDETTRSRTKAAGQILYRCNVTAATPSLTVVEKWDFATHAAANLTVHDGNVHYVEQPNAAEKFLPINSDL